MLREVGCGRKEDNIMREGRCYVEKEDIMLSERRH
jgi:hypothetical protein